MLLKEFREKESDKKILERVQASDVKLCMTYTLHTIEWHNRCYVA